MKSPHRVILASAGTGKTFCLSSTYLSLIAQGCEPSKILATTFTRKAAGEILARIFERLVRATMDARELKELKEHVDGRLTTERCAAIVASLARRMDKLQISTIDAFLGRMQRAFALDVGIAPDCQIVDDQTDKGLRALAMQKVLAAPGMGRIHAGTLLRMLRGGRPGVPVYASVLSCVDQAYSVYQRASDRAAWEIFGPDAPPPDAEAAERLAAAVKGIAIPLTKAGHPNKTWSKALVPMAAACVDRDWKKLFENGLVQKRVEGKTDYSSGPITPAAGDVLDRVILAARRGLLQRLKDRNIAIYDLMARFDEAYQGLKTANGWMRFDDVPRSLKNAAGHLDDLYYRLDGRIDHLMLDEFQDTSLDQFHILRPLIEELVSQGDDHQSRSILCVGDVKQSLYSWRGAEPELLPALPQVWPQLASEGLNKNYRSSPVILEAVNAVFGNIASNAALQQKGRAAAARFGGGYLHHTAAKVDLPGEVRLVVAPAEDPDDSAAPDAPGIEAATARAKVVAQRVLAIRQQSPEASIAVLTRTNKLVPKVIFELTCMDIPAVGEHGNPLTDSPGPSAAISAVHLAEHPGDTAAWFHLATSPLGRELGLSAGAGKEMGQAVASRLRSRIAKSGVAGLLRWMQRRIAASLDRLGLARFDQLIDLAEEFDIQGGPLDKFLRIARERAIEPPAGFDAAMPVRVLTVHTAKGLEFDAVVLPELDIEWMVRHNAILVDRRDQQGRPDPLSPVAAVTVCPRSELLDLSPELRDVHARTLDRGIGEELCGIYVAMTRAKRYLEMIVSPVKGERSAPTASKVLCAALAPGQERAAGTTLFQSAVKVPWHEGIETRKKGRPVEDSRVVFATDAAIPSGRLRRRSPSSLEGGARVDLGDLWRNGRAESGPGAAARNRGTAFHAMFESVRWLEDGLPSQASLLEAIGDAPDARAWIAQFLTAIGGKTGDSLRKSRYASRPGQAHVRREWRFTVREQSSGPETMILDGQFDRVVFGMDGGRVLWAEVVDFKTDDLAPGDAAALKRSVDFYRPQIEAYKRAAARLLKLSPGAVTAALVFSGPGEIVPV